MDGRGKRRHSRCCLTAVIARQAAGQAGNSSDHSIKSAAAASGRSDWPIHALPAAASQEMIMAG